MKELNDKNPEDQYTVTPFHLAAEKGHFEVCNAIMVYLDNKNPRTIYGYTPLHIAAQYGHLEICKSTLKQVQDKNRKDNEGITPFHKAAAGGHLNICLAAMEHFGRFFKPGRMQIIPITLLLALPLGFFRPSYSPAIESLELPNEN